MLEQWQANMSDVTFVDFLTLVSLCLCTLFLAAGLWSHDITAIMIALVFSIVCNVLQYINRKSDP